MRKFFILFILSVLILLNGCGPGAQNVKGSFFTIPMYPGATFKDTMGGTTSDLDSGKAITESRSWWYRFSDSPDKVTAFYEKSLPAARKEKSDDADVLARFKYVPAGAESEESVTISISKAEIQVTEVTKPGKRK